MAFDIVRGNIKKIQPTNDLIQSLKHIFSEGDNATLYLGYPLTANSESKVTVDALLMSEERGLIAFQFPTDFTDMDKLCDEQDSLYYALDYNFKRYPSLKKKRGRELAFKINVMTWLPIEQTIDNSDDTYVFANSSTLKGIIENITDFNPENYKLISEALQKVSNIKPRKKRENVKKEDSKGAKIRKIEAEIANLDMWQKKAALEIPEGPQRIRGLAGSGKTIVLALKAAYLHSQYPDWKIAVTFYTRSLGQQYEDLIRKFSYEFSNDEPNWDNLMIMHAWGTVQEKGIYSIASSLCNVVPTNLTTAMSKYGRQKAFDGVCSEAIGYFKDNIDPVFDAILIDEAQDMPSSFFKLCYKMIKEPKRITWAYDELQNLSEADMPTLKEMFGVDEDGNLNISIQSGENEAKRDIPLPVCYRNPPWTLSLAHALGFGLYRDKLKVQMFEDLNVWNDIGYKIEAGNLEYGQEVTLRRTKESSPAYFKELLTVEDSLICKRFESEGEQYSWVAEEIEKNIKDDELDPDDILVVFPDAYYSKSQYNNFRKYLMSRGIESILVGVNASRDIFRIEGCVSCSGIFRAKGNEAPMVYIVNSEYCATGQELIKLRNILFTAITRSRAWVRICGSGKNMELLELEYNRCVKENNCDLKFKVPTLEELQRMRKIHEEKSESDIKTINKTQKDIKSVISAIESGVVDPEMIPELEALMNLVKQAQIMEDENE